MIRTDFTKALSDIRALVPECRGITIDYPNPDYSTVSVWAKMWSEEYQSTLYLGFYITLDLIDMPDFMADFLRKQLAENETERSHDTNSEDG